MKNIYLFLLRLTPTYLLLLGIGMIFAEQAQAKPQVEQYIVNNITNIQNENYD